MAGRVLYASFATPNLSGGVGVHLQHIALLRAAGVQASLWLPAPVVPTWMGEAPVVVGTTLEVGPDDVLIYPEAPVVAGLDPAPGARKVIFNQNHFYTYATWAGPLADYPGWDPAPAVWAVSEESASVLRALHPALEVTRVPPPVDPTHFQPATVKTGVALLPKKRPHEGALLRRLFEADPRVPAGQVRVIADLPRPEVVEILSTSAVFVSLSHTDSFGLPVVEALMAGCLVVGYDGGGGVELFEAPGTWRVPEQRPLVLKERAVELLQGASGLRHLAEANRAWAVARYSPAVTGAALLPAVAAARRRPGGRATAVHPAANLGLMPTGFTKTG